MSYTPTPLALMTAPLAHKQRGLTMVEMIIASALSITLLTGVYQIYNGNKRTYTLQEELARLQENARFTMEFISQDIRKAGYTGCMRGGVSSVNNIVPAPATNTFDPFTGLQGWEAKGTEPKKTGVLFKTSSESAVTIDDKDTNWLASSASVLGTIPLAMPKSDIIRVWFGGQESQPVNSINAETITLAGALSDVEQGDIIVVSDCGRVDYVMQCRASGDKIEATQTANNTYKDCAANLNGKFLTTNADTATARRLDAAIYFVRRHDNDPDSPTGLYKRSLAGTSSSNSVLVSAGVENMQILYGEDTLGNDSVTDQYVTADNVSDWNKVITVKISLLMSSADNVATEKYRGNYDLNGVSLAPFSEDRRIRRVFSTTIALRNRV